MNPAKRHEIFSRLRAANPKPSTELEYSTPFELLVAVVLSAQATDKGVNLATRRLFPVANTPEAIFALGEAGLAEYVKTIGLYKSKARHLIATCKMLIAQHGSQVPAERAALEALPGVGRKTANVILNTAFGHPTMAVDTHIFRVANRTGLAPGKTVLEVEKKLMRMVPKEFLVDAHHWLILHGRYVCQARKPKCPVCIIADLCEYKYKTPAAPEAGKRKRNAHTPLSPALPPNGGGRKRRAPPAQTDGSAPPPQPSPQAGEGANVTPKPINV
jgi:endonuclease-3